MLSHEMAMHVAACSKQAALRAVPQTDMQQAATCKGIDSCFAILSCIPSRARTSDQRADGIAQCRNSCLLMGMEDGSGNVDIAHGALSCGHLNPWPAHSNRGGDQPSK